LPTVSESLGEAAPSFAKEVAGLVAGWLAPLKRRLDRAQISDLRAKQLNDAVWGTVELHPWEVALLDTPLIQRLRGVRQNSLAHYVFPGAVHDRFEHSCGVIGAVEAIIQALSRQIERANLVPGATPLPTIEKRDHYALRLAALLHDIGHGPFSHVIEPLIAHSRTLGEDVPQAPWRAEVAAAQACLKRIYSLNKPPSVSETIAVMMITALPMREILGHSNLAFVRPAAAELEAQIVATVIGAVEGPGASHLTRIVSSQIDGDKLDYLVRDAHHSGLKIGFDTDHLLAKLEVLRVSGDSLSPAEEDLRHRADRARERHYFDIGIAASGFGSFEQMLIGRTFLYDRLYHHHKVRAADAMALRLALAAETERGRPFALCELFLPVSDDTMIRLLGGDVRHDTIKGGGEGARRLATAILTRELYHRAYAFRGRFIMCPEHLKEEAKESLRRGKWTAVSRGLERLEDRIALEREIHGLALKIAQRLKEAGVKEAGADDAVAAIEGSSDDMVIVDLPEQKAEAIRILARYPDGSLRVPEFSFNPVKWADAYELQKRTGYVFCPRDAVPVVSVAAKITFLKQFGAVMNADADAFIKARADLPRSWQEALRQDDFLEDTVFEYIERRRYSLLKVSERHVPAPAAWIEDDPDFAIRLVSIINKYLPAGLVEEDICALQSSFRGLFAFIDNWHTGHNITGSVKSEADLQDRLRTFLTGHGLKVTEGATMSGGQFDLLLQDRILLENKFAGKETDPENCAVAAATQGRRYAVAVGSRVVFVPLAYIPEKGAVPSKPRSFVARPVSPGDDRRVEIRVLIPYGAPVPSREAPLKAAPAATPPASHIAGR
jgi:HD superfamily phosphohydrolase